MRETTEIRQSIQRMVCTKCGAEANASWKARSDEGLSLPPIDNLVNKNKYNDFEATPWFASRIKPIFERTIKNDAAASAAALSQFKTACATLLPQMTVNDLQMAQHFLDAVGYLEQNVNDAIREAEDAAANNRIPYRR